MTVHDRKIRPDKAQADFALYANVSARRLVAGDTLKARALRQLRDELAMAERFCGKEEIERARRRIALLLGRD
jgi:hypothetical protein